MYFLFWLFCSVPVFFLNYRKRNINIGFGLGLFFFTISPTRLFAEYVLLMGFAFAGQGQSIWIRRWV